LIINLKSFLHRRSIVEKEKMSKTRRVVKVKEENEIQSYINSFKEIEELEEEPSTSNVGKKIQEDTEYEQIIEREDAGAEDEFKYVFIVQDEEDGGGEKQDGEEVYDFDEYEGEETTEEGDDKAKIVKILSHATVKKANASGGVQSSSSQVHMCSYCNYNTPKRYLLARHMKCHSEDR
jgi:hypothetical protein